MIIGICGKSGSGKSTLSRKLQNIYTNSIHIDVDKIGHNVLTIDEVKQELIKCFGENILNENIVDRKKLGELVFSSRNAMKSLSNITWKYMQLELYEIIKKNKDKIIILDWLLLYETQFFDMCDLKILLDIPYETRKKRALLRDNITEEAFDLRDANSNQFDRCKFDIVYNEENICNIERLVKKIDKSALSR